MSMEEGRSEGPSRMNVPFPKFSITELLSRRGKETDLDLIFSTKAQIHFVRAGRKKSLFSCLILS